MQKFFKSISYLVMVHITALLLQVILRALFLTAVSNQLTDDVRGDWALTFTAFLRGLWFDNVIGCYILLLPLLVLCIASLFNYYGPRMFRAVGIFLGVMYALNFMAATANIPYFEYFTKPLNSSIWNWAEYGTTTLGMMFGEASYYLYIGYFILFTTLFCLLLRFYEKRLLHTLKASGPARGNWKINCAKGCIGAALIGLCFFGIRGRRGYNPIKVSAAYFCDNPILNQLGVNATFCLLTSTLDDMRKENRRLCLMDDQQAVIQVQQLLNRTGIEQISPIARIISPKDKPTQQNVVVVFMESLSAKFLQRFGGKGLTPTIDSLWQHSLSFSNFYSAGNHTNHGLYASLYGFPSIMKRNAMKGSAIPNYSGLATVLKEQGYRTLFFMTHEAQYDNMNAFFRSNGFTDIYAQENYPKEKIANHFGVQDDFLFEYALPRLREASQNGPFMATLLTITNHPPYVLPDYFHPTSSHPEEQVVEYADWSIAQFMKAAAKEEWFGNTIFVFLGDHGKMVGQADCELPESYNHVPFMIYGKGISPEERNDFAGQVDMTPTILGMLNIPYTQNNLGIDLLREKRPCIFYTADNTVAARDSLHLYVYNPDADGEFCYRIENEKPAPAQMDSTFQSLKKYCFSMLQATEWMVEQGMTTDQISSTRP